MDVGYDFPGNRLMELGSLFEASIRDLRETGVDVDRLDMDIWVRVDPRVTMQHLMQALEQFRGRGLIGFSELGTVRTEAQHACALVVRQQAPQVRVSGPQEYSEEDELLPDLSEDSKHR